MLDYKHLVSKFFVAANDVIYTSLLKPTFFISDELEKRADCTCEDYSQGILRPAWGCSYREKYCGPALPLGMCCSRYK